MLFRLQVLNSLPQPIQSTEKQTESEFPSLSLVLPDAPSNTGGRLVLSITAAS